MWAFANPVKITFGNGSLRHLGNLVGARSYCLVTYDEPYFAALTERISHIGGPPAVVIDNITPNPEFHGLSDSCARYDQARTPPDVIVAVGGGSVLDAAKVLAVAKGEFARVRKYLEHGDGADELGSVPIIAVPTTAGTGSEVTSWATVWDTDAGKKYSLARPSLYSEHALVDPELMLGLPRDLTVSTGLDALSHSLESIWNHNANPVSRHFAVFAAREMLATLAQLATNLGDIDLRGRAARAALFAGLAFSNTKTALAHSLSYPITLRHGFPHGLACSFSLPAVMRSVIGVDDECDAALRQIFGPDLAAGAERMGELLTGLGVSVTAADYGVEEAELHDLIEQALAGERGRNFIGQPERVFEAFGFPGNESVPGQRSTA